MAKHIYLVGFMASGKSTIGRMLADVLSRPFIDTDAEIEKRQGITVTQIFENQGEAAFRKMEADLLQEISSHNESWVVATGGGLMLNAGAYECMAKSGVIFFLKRSFKKMMAEIYINSKRPLAKIKGKKELYLRYKARLPIYRKANWVIYNRNEVDTIKKIQAHLE